MAGGVAGFVASVVVGGVSCAETVGVGCTLAVTGAVSSTDHVTTGWDNLGKPQRQQRITAIVSGLKAAGISEETANYIQLGLDIFGAGGSINTSRQIVLKEMRNSAKVATHIDNIGYIKIPKVANTCSFHGDMEVKTADGYKPIHSIQVGDSVYARNERTGQKAYQLVQAHYRNQYDTTVYVETITPKGKRQTIVSNTIHPFFTKIKQGEVVPSSEGHYYQGNIPNAQWVNAEHLKVGYQLLTEDEQWQTIENIKIQKESLTAYNLTVANDHTYFIKGMNTDAEGVWVHNDCWHALPKDAKRVKDIDGYQAYKFKDIDSKDVTVVKRDINRFETLNHQVGKDPHFNSLSQRIDESTGRYLSTDNPVDQLYNRAYLRSDTMKKIFEQYDILPNGNYRDKVTREVIKGPIDIGHAYGWEHRRLSLAAKELNWSQKQFNDYVNARPEKFRLENMSVNRSHKNEMPGKGDILEIKKDMQYFMNRGN
ncbi:hypothetical protein F9B74_09935 [Pelistega sp. NLN82]|uniref:Hint domain-containing protein n=1 Tax=Pelistega ratti TaxID=2652177 RepID=A0A6L9YA74_9BURK|nr:polymorphic toxin-type HINT domain-containing protein [Pelistega ratti]NEN76624.1 hypothetical protein [Pelistega ratti]